MVGAHATQWTGNVNFFLGQKSLDSDDWSPLDEQGEFGVLVDFRNKNWPVSIALDFLGSADDTSVSGIKLDAMTSEFNAGVRKIWEVQGSSVKPYLGGGIAFIRAEAEGAAFPVVVTEDDNGTGIWLNGGVYWTLGQHFNLGLDLRYSQADVTLFGVDAKAGGSHVGLLLGYHW
jgi:opacity protein-like surface antigen